MKVLELIDHKSHVTITKEDDNYLLTRKYKGTNEVTTLEFSCEIEAIKKGLELLGKDYILKEVV
jgi:hypothetical protein